MKYIKKPVVRSPLIPLARNSGQMGFAANGISVANVFFEPSYVAEFDGQLGSYIEIPYNSDLINPAASMSFGGWFNTVASGNHGFISKNVNTQWALFQEGTNIRLRMALNENDVIAAVPSPGYHHILATVNGTVGKIYIDGSEVSSGTCNAIPADDGSTPVRICQLGSVYPNPGPAFDAFIANWDLEAEDVLRLYNGNDLDKLNAYFNGTDASVTIDTPFSLSGDFSISFDTIFDSSNNIDRPILGRVGATNNVLLLRKDRIAYDTGANIINFSVDAPEDEWVRVNISRVSDLLTVSLNGTQVVSSTEVDNITSIDRIGQRFTTSWYEGYLRNFRVINQGSVEIDAALTEDVSNHGSNSLTDNNIKFRTKPVVRYKLNEPTDFAIDSSGNNNHGSFEGNSYLVPHIENYYSFDGTDDKDIRVSIENINYPFSMCGWIRNSSNATQDGSIIAIGDESNAAIYILLQFKNDNSGFNILRRNTTLNTSSVSYSTQDDVWYNVSAVFESETAFKLYVNGVEVQSFSAEPSVSLSSNFDIFYSGRLRVLDSIAKLYGDISDLRLYNNELTSEQVACIYRGKAINELPVAWFKLDSATVKNEITGELATNNGATFTTDSLPVSLTKDDFNLDSNSCERGLGYSIGQGQSLSIGARSTPSNTTTAPVPDRALMFNGGIRANYNFHDGTSGNVNLQIDSGQLASVTDLLEEDITVSSDDFGETVFGGFSSSFVKKLAKDGILATAMGRGAYRYDLLELGTIHFAHSVLGMYQHKMHLPSDFDYAFCSDLILQHGEADSSNATGRSTYKGYLKQWRKDFQKYAELVYEDKQSFEIPAFVIQQNNHNYTSSGQDSIDISFGQLDASYEDPNIVIAAGYQFQRDADGVHLTADSEENLGKLLGKLKEIRLKDSTFQGFRPSSVTLNGTTITVSLEGNNSKNVVWNTTDVASKTDKGFEVTGANIDAIYIENNEVIIECDAVPTAMAYAKTQTGTLAGPGFGLDSGSARGNLATDEPVPSFCVAFEVTSFPWSKPDQDAAASPPSVGTHSYTANEQAVVGYNPVTWLRADSSLVSSGEILCFAKSGNNWTDEGASRVTESNSNEFFDFTGIAGDLITGPAVASMGDVTFAFVLKAANSGQTQSLLGSPTKNSSNMEWVLATNQSRLQYGVTTSNGYIGSTFQGTISNNIICNVIICHKYEGNRTRVYHNGTLLGTLTNMDHLNCNPQLVIGDASRNNPFTGRVSDFVMFHKDISDDATALAALQAMLDDRL